MIDMGQIGVPVRATAQTYGGGKRLKSHTDIVPCGELAAQVPQASHNRGCKSRHVERQIGMHSNLTYPITEGVVETSSGMSNVLGCVSVFSHPS